MEHTSVGEVLEFRLSDHEICGGHSDNPRDLHLWHSIGEVDKSLHFINSQSLDTAIYEDRSETNSPSVCCWSSFHKVSCSDL